MPAPRYQRRKEQRPAEIAEAALAEFAENGYSATRVGDVASRAGVSKGLLYVYYKTKEDLFKAVIRNFVAPKITRLSGQVDHSTDSSEAFLRGPFLTFIKSLPGSPAQVLIRLMIAEGPRHPDLTRYYLRNVVEPGLATLRKLVQRGVDRGEFRATALTEFPQLIMSPVLFALLWKLIFDAQQALDVDRFLESHIDILVNHLQAPESAGGKL